MKTITIHPSVLSGKVKIIASKSLSHRFLIGAALSPGVSTLRGLMESDDIARTKAALLALGATIEGPRIKGGFPRLQTPYINAGASGSTVRFLIPVAMLQEKPVVFDGEQRLPQRSLQSYETLFTAKGVLYEKLSDAHLPVRVAGPLQPGTYRVRGDVSSQFITGLLFALPCLDGDSRLIIDGPFQSQSYVKLSVDVLRRFGVHVRRNKEGYHIPGKQTYTPVTVDVEGDYSQAAFFIAAALINKNPLVLTNLDPHSQQGDQAILTIVKQMGGSVSWDEDKLVVSPSNLSGINIDLADIPDLGPILMILAALSDGETTFTNIKRLRYKESDRVQAMESVLNALGVDTVVSENAMRVNGAQSFKGNVTLDSFDDHRIAMAIVVASLRCLSPITLTNALAINKSYPTFLNEFSSLGGIIRSNKEGEKT